jgi:hypothetical protein
VAISSTLQAQLAAAWNNTNAWIASGLPQLATGALLPNYSYSVDTGMCQFLNAPTPQAPLPVTASGLAEGIWESNGNGQMNLTGMSLATLSGTGAAAASFSASGASFPVSFSQLLVHGAYNYAQPCQRQEVGPNIRTTTHGNGNMSQQWSGQQMILNCAVAANGVVSLTSVTITGTPAATPIVLQPTSVIPGANTEIAAAITNAFGSNNAVADAIANSLANASFIQMLIRTLNANIQKVIAAPA